MKLKQSKVRFIECTHQYFLDDLELHGITGMLERQLFPLDLAGIAPDVLQRAADYGTNVHNRCEDFDNNGTLVEDCPELVQYVLMRNGNEWKHECSEYLVSDNEYFASKIDKVYRVDNTTFDLGDIKTCSKSTMNREKLRWQLSIYAYMFERQNPRCKVRNLFGIWLNCKGNNKIAEVINVDRIPDAEVAALLDAERNGQKYTCNVTAVDTMPANVIAMQQQVAELLRVEQETKTRLEELKKGLLQMMEETGALSWKGDIISVSYRKAYTTTSFDNETFLAFAPEMADLMAKCVKTKQVSGSVTIKLNKK